MALVRHDPADEEEICSLLGPPEPVAVAGIGLRIQQRCVRRDELYVLDTELAQLPSRVLGVRHPVAHTRAQLAQLESPSLQHDRSVSFVGFEEPCRSDVVVVDEPSFLALGQEARHPARAGRGLIKDEIRALSRRTLPRVIDEPARLGSKFPVDVLGPDVPVQTGVGQNTPRCKRMVPDRVPETEVRQELVNLGAPHTYAPAETDARAASTRCIAV